MEAKHRILELPKSVSIPDDGVKRRQKPNDVLLTDVLLLSLPVKTGRMLGLYLAVFSGRSVPMIAVRVVIKSVKQMSWSEEAPGLIILRSSGNG